MTKPTVKKFLSLVWFMIEVPEKYVYVRKSKVSDTVVNNYNRNAS